MDGCMTLSQSAAVTENFPEKEHITLKKCMEQQSPTQAKHYKHKSAYLELQTF